jgi:hypothetical protein
MFREGYGLQAVRKCFAMNPALAAEGPFPSKQRFFRKLFSRVLLRITAVATGAPPPPYPQPDFRYAGPSIVWSTKSTPLSPPFR